MTEKGAKDKLTELFSSIQCAASSGGFSDIVLSADQAYQRSRKKPLDPMKKAILQNSLNRYAEYLIQSNQADRAKIFSATQDITAVDNPITLMFNLMSILVPNFAYNEVIGQQPMPTKDSPIIFPQITAGTTRNGISSGTELLGASNWESSNLYSTNKTTASGTLAASTAQSITLASHPVKPGSVNLTLTVAIPNDDPFIAVLHDDGSGGFNTVTGISAASINYTTGVISITLASAAAATDTYAANYRYDISTVDPAQILIEFGSKLVQANPYRLRSSYSLENFYSAKQVLKDYDIDAVLSSTLAGYINKDISCGVFDDMLDWADADYTWNSTPGSGVAWALHRLSALQTLISASNAIRSSVSRCEGNKLVIGTDWANIIETLGDDVWKPIIYKDTPIGPYLEGRLLDRFDVVKNQDYSATKAMMCYKKSEIDASTMGGTYIALYATNPLAMDTLKVVQGMGTQFGYEKAFDNSIVSVTMTTS